MAITAPRGTEDLLGSKANAWDVMCAKAAEIFSRYGYKMASTPIFEHQDVFIRGIGQSTDVVSKEMFHVLSKDAYSKVSSGEKPDDAQNLSLRPEGTAGIVRSVIEHNLVPAGGPVVKLMYAGSMFRCERQQKGRLREFHQIGAECLGAIDPSCDAEMIEMLMAFFTELGIEVSSMKLYINSMGDDSCRPAYRQMIKDFILDHTEDLCEDCIKRAQINPLRAFDCKNEKCTKIMSNAPSIIDNLCDDCKDHYDKVKEYLAISGISYEEDPRLVRGLDYYTRTVFEVQVDAGLGSQNAIGGGGRYDKLVEVMGGKPTAGIGFALGFERTLLALDYAGVELEDQQTCDCYVAIVDKSCSNLAYELVSQMRHLGVHCDMDHQSRSLKSQFKQADRMQSKYVVIVGPEELEANEATIREMATHEQRRVSISTIAEDIAKACSKL